MGNVTLSWHPLFEFDVAHIKVSNNPQFLFIIGNDLLSENSMYRFDGITKSISESYLTFYDKVKDIYVKVKR
mgnify:FL=1